MICRLHQQRKALDVLHDYDGNRLAEYEYDAATSTSTLLREYIWLDGEAVGVVEGGVVYFVRTDHIGRPVFATDSAGAKVWTAAYLPFGEVRVSTGNPIELRFPGQWYQSESGLHQNWMREYDPTTGRYFQADPLGLVDGPSVYGYALQNPGKYTDILGLDVFLSNSSSAASGFGHLGISTNPIQTNGYYSIGEEANGISCGNAGCSFSGPGVVKPDDMTRVTEMIRYYTTPAQDAKLNSCIVRRTLNPGRYHLLNRSCADFARDCLKEIGIKLPPGNQPNDIFRRELGIQFQERNLSRPARGVQIRGHIP